MNVTRPSGTARTLSLSKFRHPRRISVKVESYSFAASPPPSPTLLLLLLLFRLPPHSGPQSRHHLYRQHLTQNAKMSMVPLLFRDWWNDNESPSRLIDQHFGLGVNREELLSNFLRPHRHYVRPWALARQNSGSSCLSADKDRFQVILDVQQFAPGEISVKTTDGALIVEGKHEEKQDEHGFISRQFKRRYVLPKDLDFSEVTSSLSSDGVLTITAPKKKELPAGERSVPIVQTGVPAAVNVAPESPAPAQATGTTPTLTTPITTNIKIQRE